MCRLPTLHRVVDDPLGQREPVWQYPNYVAEALEPGYAITLAMVETEEAVTNLDAILDTPHLTGVYIGPNDLAVSLGVAPGPDPTDATVTDAIDYILERTRAHGLKCGIHCFAVRGHVGRGVASVHGTLSLTLVTP